ARRGRWRGRGRTGQSVRLVPEGPADARRRHPARLPAGRGQRPGRHAYGPAHPGLDGADRSRDPGGAHHLRNPVEGDLRSVLIPRPRPVRARANGADRRRGAPAPRGPGIALRLTHPAATPAPADAPSAPPPRPGGRPPRCRSARPPPTPTAPAPRATTRPGRPSRAGLA